MRQKHLILAAAVILAVATGVLFAQGPLAAGQAGNRPFAQFLAARQAGGANAGAGWHSMMGRGLFGQLAAEYLELSESQQAMLAGFREEAVQKRKDGMQLRREMREAIQAGDQGKINQLADQAGARVAAAIKEGAAKWAQFQATLTPEQREKIEKLRSRFEERRANWRAKLAGGEAKP